MKNFSLDYPVCSQLPNLAGALGMFMKIDEATDVQNVSFDELLIFVKQIKKNEYKSLSEVALYRKLFDGVIEVLRKNNFHEEVRYFVGLKNSQPYNYDASLPNNTVKHKVVGQSKKLAYKLMFSVASIIQFFKKRLSFRYFFQ